MRYRTFTLAAVTALTVGTAGPLAAQTDVVEQTDAEVVNLMDWDQTQLYQGWQVSELMDAEVIGAAGEEIGEVEDVLFSPDGSVDSIIVEGGGIWDIGDTHFRVEWDQVTVNSMDSVTIPMTEETVEDFSVYRDWDDRAATRRWRATELIGDYATLKDVDQYGIVDDLIVKDGQLEAVVVSPDVAYGTRGYYAYPYYGYGYGYEPGVDYYGLPYEEADIVDYDPFDYDAMDY